MKKPTRHSELYRKDAEQLFTSVMNDEQSLVSAREEFTARNGIKELYRLSLGLKKLPADYSRQRYARQNRDGRGLRTLYITGEAASGKSTVLRRTRNAFKGVHGASHPLLLDETLKGATALHKGLYLAGDMANVAVFDDVMPDAFSVKNFLAVLDKDVPYAYKNPSGNTCYFTPEMALLANERSIGEWLFRCAYMNYNRLTWREKRKRSEVESKPLLKKEALGTLIAMANRLPLVVTVGERHERGKCLVIRRFNERLARRHTGPIDERDIDGWYVDMKRYPYPDTDALTRSETHESIEQLLAYIRSH